MREEQLFFSIRETVIGGTPRALPPLLQKFLLERPIPGWIELIIEQRKSVVYFIRQLLRSYDNMSTYNICSAVQCAQRSTDNKDFIFHEFHIQSTDLFPFPLLFPPTPPLLFRSLAFL